MSDFLSQPKDPNACQNICQSICQTVCPSIHHSTCWGKCKLACRFTLFQNTCRNMSEPRRKNQCQSICQSMLQNQFTSRCRCLPWNCWRHKNVSRQNPTILVDWGTNVNDESLGQRLKRTGAFLFYYTT